MASHLLYMCVEYFICRTFRSDTETNERVKDRLVSLSVTVMSALETIVTKTEEKVDTATELLQAILASAAEDDGEFLVPLSDSKKASLRSSVLSNLGSLDESFIATVNAWVRKSQDDGLEGMVDILRGVLQQFASVSLMEDKSVTPYTQVSTPPRALDRLLATPPDMWDSAIAEILGGFVCTKEVLELEVQSRIESVVLDFPAGSYAQKVTAEYMKELRDRISNQGKVAVE